MRLQPAETIGALVVLLFAIALPPESRADTLFTISGPTVSGEVDTSVSLAAIEAASGGNGVYDITGELNSVSLTADGYTLTLGNLFTFGNSNYDFALTVSDGAITGWDFGGFDGSDLIFNSLDGGYDGSTEAIVTAFGFGANRLGTGGQDIVQLATGCTALGTASENCTSVTLGGMNTSTFGELTITSPTPEPDTLAMLGTGLFGLGFIRRKFFS